MSQTGYRLFIPINGAMLSALRRRHRIKPKAIGVRLPGSSAKRSPAFRMPWRWDGGPATLLSYCEKAGLDAFQINFHGNRNLDRLLQSMECFMQDVAPIVSGERIA
jgi:hypothetical protein